MLIEGYRISDQVSQDVIGETFLASRPESGTNVFIKFLHEDFLSDPDLVKCFHACAEAGSSVSQDEFTRIISYGRENDRVYVIFDQFDLPSLGTTLERTRVIPVLDASHLIETLAAALQTCHDKGVVHGALSPSCVFYDSVSRQLKIGSVGFAPFFKALMSRKHTMLADDLAYFAPEMVNAKGALVAQTDVFSLGCLYYRLIVGSRPWPEMSDSDFFGEKARTSLVPPSLQRLEVPDILDNVITEAMELEIGHRQPNPGQLFSEIVETRNEMLASFTPTSAFIYERREDEKAESPADEFDSENSVEPSPVIEARNGVESSGEPGTPDTLPADNAEEPVDAEDTSQQFLDDLERFEQELFVASESAATLPDLETTFSPEAKEDEEVEPESTDAETAEQPLPGLEPVSANAAFEGDSPLAQIVEMSESESAEQLSESDAEPGAPDEPAVSEEPEHTVGPTESPDPRQAEKELDPQVPADIEADMFPADVPDLLPTVDAPEASSVEVEPVLNATEEEQPSDVLDFMGSTMPRRAGAPRSFPSIQSHLFDDRTSELLPRRQKLNGTARPVAKQQPFSPKPERRRAARPQPQPDTNSEYIVTLSKPAPAANSGSSKPRTSRHKEESPAANAADPTINEKTPETVDIRPNGTKAWLAAPWFNMVVWRIAPVVVVALVVLIAIDMGMPGRIKKSAFFTHRTGNKGQSNGESTHAVAQRVPGNSPERLKVRRTTQQPANRIGSGTAFALTKIGDREPRTPANSGTAQRARAEDVKTTRRVAASTAGKVQTPIGLNLNVQVHSFGAPQVAEVFVDGASYGQTNDQGRLLIPNLKNARPYLVKVKKNGYQLWAKEVFFPQPGEQRVNVNLATLLQASKQPAATPLTNGNTSVNPNKAAQSTRKASANGPSTGGNAGNTAAGTQQGVFGTVNVRLANTESLADAYIYINGRRWTGPEYIAPARIELPPGSYTIAVRKNGYVTAPPSYTLDIVDGESRTVSFILTAN